MELIDKFRHGAIQAISQSGKNKGRFKSSSPKVNTYGSAVWQAMMVVTNPYKVNVSHLLFMDDDVREVHEFAVKVFEEYRVHKGNEAITNQDVPL
jgi:hypothetical protein